jgi:hypothetical protein
MTTTDDEVLSSSLIRVHRTHPFVSSLGISSLFAVLNPPPLSLPVSTLARLLVEVAYGISPANAKRDNGNLVEDLQDRIGFAYKACSPFCDSFI